MKRVLFPMLLFVLAAITAFTSVEEQIFNTSLQLTIRNNLGNTEEGVKVALYSNDDDYTNEKNPVVEPQKTDAKGRVKFKGLEEKAYYVNAVKGDMNNYGGGVQTDTLQSKRMNKVTIVID